MALALSDDEKEYLLELRDHPAWLMFWDKVVRPALITPHVVQVMQYTREGDARQATYAQGRHDGVIDVLEVLYKAIGEKTPPHIGKLRRESI